MPSSDQLLAHNHTVDEICKIIGADSLGYLDINRLGELAGSKPGYCDACFSGNYPVKPPEEDIRSGYKH